MIDEDDERLDREYEASHRRFKVTYMMKCTYSIDVDISNCSEDSVEDEIKKAIENMDNKEIASCEHVVDDCDIVKYEEDPWW